MANADISLLFGVLGEGSLGGESGSLIQSQLTQIMAALNKNPLKVKVALDTEAGGQKSWSSQLQSKLNTVSSSGKFSVQVSKLTLGAGAISDFRNQLNAVVNTLHLDKGTTITLTAEGIGEIKSKMKQAGDAAADAARKTAEFKVQMEALSRQKTSVQRALSSLSASAATEEERAKVAELTTQYEQWAVKIEQIRATKTAASSGYRAEIEAEGAAIANNIEMLRQKQAEDAAAAAAATSSAAEQAAAEESVASAAERGAAANKDAATEQKDLNNARRQGLSLLTQMQKAERDWTAAKTGKTSTEYTQIQDSIRSLQIYLAQLKSGEIDITTFKQHLAELGGTFASSSNAIKLAGENARTFGERMGGLAKKFGAWLSVTRVIMTVIQTIRKMVTNTRDIDTSLTQLRIVTGATDKEMEAFLTKSTQLAKELGQSITNVLGSIETFSRLGYNLGDASQLAEYANVLANVAAVGTDEATTGLTSIIKGFNMDVSEAEHVADVLVEVGQKYAVSASEMMEAYEKSGAALNATNTSFEKSAGLIAAANASVQNASTVGTALKTISARIRGATADLEALGEDTNDLAQGFSKYAKEIKALTGFDIMVDGSTDTYKDIYDIFEGISKVWKDLSDTQQARVSEILGGTRQLQVISSILGNWKDAAGAYSDAMASAGTATEANAVYMDSINGKIGILSATFQEFSNNLINSGLIKFFIELGTAIISALNALEKLHLLLPMVVSVVVTIKALRAGLAAMHGAVTAAETASAINTIVAKLVAEKTATDALTVAVANLTIAEKAELATKIQSSIASGALTAEEGQQILTTLGLATAEGTLTVANHTLGASFKALMASIPVWGWIALGVSLLITAVTALSGAFKSNEQKVEELNEEYNSLYSTIKNVSSEFKSLKASADEVIPRFAELAKGVNQFGDNVSLTDEEYAEFLELNNRVAEMFPELNLGMDESGNYMLALSYGADTLTESLYGLLEAQRLVAAQELANTLPDLVKNVKEQEKIYDKEKKVLQDRLDYYQEAYDAYAELFSRESVNKYKEAYGDDWEYGIQAAADRMAVTYTSYIGQAFDAIGNSESWERMLEKFTDDTTGFVDWWEVLNSSEFKNVIAGMERELDNFDDKIQAKWNSINPAVNAWLQTDFIYNDMNEQMQAIARAMVSGLDFTELGLTTAESIENYITDYIINPLYSSGADVRTAFADITNWQNELRSGEITFEQFSERVENVFNDLISSMSDDEAKTFADNFVAGFNAIGIAGRDFDDVVSNIIDNWGAVTGAVESNTTRVIGDLAEELEDLKKAYSLLSTAQEEMGSGKGLSADTISELAAAEKNYLDYLYEENGIIKLNTEMWKENANAKMKGDISGIQAEIDALEKANDALREQINAIENMEVDTTKLPIIGDIIGGEWLDKIGESAKGGALSLLTNQLKANTEAIEENQAKLALYTSLYGSITGDLDAYSAALANFESISATVDGISDSFQTLADLQAQVANGFTMSLDKALEFAKVYPEILNNAQVSANGQITLNEDVVNSFLQGKKAELDAQIDSQIAQLEADKAVLEAKMEAAQAQLDIAKNVGEGEGQIAKELAEYRINAGNAVAQAMIEAGIDEATAFKLAAAAMAQNAEEFDRVAMEVCTDVNGNFNQAAFDLAQTMYKNLTNVKTDLSSVAKQAHETAKAIAGIANGDPSKGSTNIQSGSGGGVGNGEIKLNLTSGSFNGTEYTYTAKESGLEDFIAKIELDISDYQNAISQIDGQIAVLKALKNAPLKSFKSKTSGGGSGSSSKKEVEEYTASIDDYREALERLRIAQKATADVQREIDLAPDMRISTQEDVALLQEENDRLNERNRLLEDALGAIEYYSEVQKDIAENGIDTERTVFGNIDLNNRKVLEWTEDAISAYRKAIDSWGESADDLLGSVSTVLGTWNEFDGVPIAFSPMLQTENGAVYLDSDTVYKYIWGLIDKAGEGWRSEDLLRLDTEGLEFDGVVIKNLLADIGDTAEKTAQSMHFLGTDGAINASYREISDAAEALGISIEELIQNYDLYNAEIDQNDTLLERNIALINEAASATTSRFDALRREIALQQQLVNTYVEQQAALDNLNGLKDSTISAGVQALRDLGFAVAYNAETDDLWIANLEHLNELTADSKGEYDTLQEATNALRKETEELINSITNLNDENRESNETWLELKDSIQEAKKEVISLLGEIVTTASDAVDEIQNVFDVLKDAADEYAENGGFISVDAFQKIIELGPQYMQYLRDENGLLIINEESINRVIEAKVRQLAAEQALTYVERIRLALQENSIEKLETLLFATTDATNATFGLAYAELELMHNMGDLNDSQYAAALHNIQAIEDLANTTIAGIGKVSGEYSENLKKELENMKSGLDDILKYVMDMLKHRIQQQIDALNDMKDAYRKIIDLRKEALDAAKKEAEYEDKVADKVKKIAKLQEQINALSLDDSRDAKAQKAKLEEELAELQKELADEQNDYAVDAQKEALDDMEEAYKNEKDAEIKALEETISSYQKLYDMAIAYIESHWNTLYDELIAWNTEYGSVLNSEITTAWENCLAAAQRYGSYVSALNSIDNDIAAAGSGSSGSGSNNTIVGTSGNKSASSSEDSIHAIIKEMYANSQAWGAADATRKNALDKRNLQLGSMLAQYGINASRGSDGAWYVNGGELLYDKYRKYIYHKGGIAGDNPTLKQNEIMAVLEKGEAVLDKQKEKGLYRLVEFATTLSDKFAELIRSTDIRQSLFNNGGFADAKSDIPTNVSDNREIHIEFGDTYITGTNEETVEKHRAITRQQANELLEQLNIKR